MATENRCVKSKRLAASATSPAPVLSLQCCLFYVVIGKDFTDSLIPFNVRKKKGNS